MIMQSGFSQFRNQNVRVTNNSNIFFANVILKIKINYIFFSNQVNPARSIHELEQSLMWIIYWRKSNQDFLISFYLSIILIYFHTLLFFFIRGFFLPCRAGMSGEGKTWRWSEMIETFQILLFCFYNLLIRTNCEIVISRIII